MLGASACRIRIDGEVKEIDIYDESLDVPCDFVALIRTVVEDYGYLLG